MSTYKNINRMVNGLGAAICGASLIIAVFYMGQVLHLPPCPLCILSRYVVAVMLIVFVIALVDNGKYVRQCVYPIVNAIFALIGLVIAGRHLWVQNHPSLTCSLGSDSNNFLHFITHAFAGSSDCAIKSWEFMGLSIPEQTIVLFAGLLALLIFQLYRDLKSRR